jgi:hypothetical protein
MGANRFAVKHSDSEQEKTLSRARFALPSQAVNMTINSCKVLRAMKPQIEDVTISMLKPKEFIAEMVPDLDIDEINEGLAKHTRKVAQALLDSKCRRNRQMCDSLYSCLGGVKQCNLPLCPLCVQRLRISLALGVREYLGQLLLNPKLSMSVFAADVPGGSRPIGHLNRINLRQINHVIKEQLKALRLPLVLAGVNVSLIENGLAKTSFWQAHVSGVVVGLSARRARKVLKELYPGDRWAQYPEGYPGYTLPQALGETVWPDYIRQVERLDPWWGADGEIGFATRTVHLALHPPQMRELAEWLAQYEMSARYALIGCRRNKTVSS